MEGERPPRVRADYRRRSRGSRIGAFFGVIVGFGLVAAIAWAASAWGSAGAAAAERLLDRRVDTAPPKPILRIVFPEGFTRKEMAGRIAAVNEIAVEERGIPRRCVPRQYLRATRT